MCQITSPLLISAVTSFSYTFRPRARRVTLRPWWLVHSMNPQMTDAALGHLSFQAERSQLCFGTSVQKRQVKGVRATRNYIVVNNAWLAKRQIWNFILG